MINGNWTFHSGSGAQSIQELAPYLLYAIPLLFALSLILLYLQSREKLEKKKVKYNPFPESIGGESWLLFKARQMGWHVKVVPAARYVHLKPYGSYTVWTNGQSMYVNGYPFFIVLLRVLKNLVFREGLAQLGMIGGFIQYAVRGEPKLDMARFAYQFEVERLRRLINH